MTPISDLIYSKTPLAMNYEMNPYNVGFRPKKLNHLTLLVVSQFR